MSVSQTAQQSTRRETFPLGATLLALVCMLLLGVTTIWGALSTNRRMGEDLLAQKMREVLIAQANDLDLTSVRRGKSLYMGTCTACHGPQGKAKPNLGKDIRESEFIAGQTDSQLEMFLKLGRNTWDPLNTTGVAMPPKGGNPMLTDDDLADIVQYMRFLQADAQESQSQGG